MANFIILHEEKAPDPMRRSKEEYKKLYNALENLSTDQVILITFKDIKEKNRYYNMIKHYFGSGAFSFRMVSKEEYKYIIKHKTKDK